MPAGIIPAGSPLYMDQVQANTISTHFLSPSHFTEINTADKKHPSRYFSKIKKSQNSYLY